jgi:hypothetical protein
MRRGRVSPRSSGRSDLQCARFWRTAEWRVPDRCATDAQARVDDPELAWIGAADRRATRATIPQCRHGYEREAGGTCEIAAGRNTSQASQPRPYASKAWRITRLESPPSSEATCELCGESVHKRRRRHCDACIPKARRERGLRAIEAARKALAVQAAEGNDPRASDRVGPKRGEAISEQHRGNREWARGAEPAERDRAWFLREVALKLDGDSLSQIAKATGLSLAACSRIRAGARVPHPRHWDELIALVGA